jgi:hypothetical protein
MTCRRECSVRTATRPPFHALRSALIALTVVSLAAAAHVFAGGQLPAPGILLAFLALTGLATTAATRLKLNTPAMAGLLGAGQLLLHEAFTVFSGTVAGSGGAAGHHAYAAFPAQPPIAAHSKLHELDSALSLLMLAAHALATLACAVLLARGEDALWALAAWLRPLTRLPAAATAQAVTERAPALWPADSAPLPRRNLRRDCRRGPPAAVVCS